MISQRDIDRWSEFYTHSVISLVDGWSYFIVSWIEFDKTSGGLPTSPSRSSSNAAALESNRCLNLFFSHSNGNRSRTYLTTRLSSLLTASVSSLFIPDASRGVNGNNHLELAGDWNRYFLIKWDSRAKIIIWVKVYVSTKYYGFKHCRSWRPYPCDLQSEPNEPIRTEIWNIHLINGSSYVKEMQSHEENHWIVILRLRVQFRHPNIQHHSRMRFLLFVLDQSRVGVSITYYGFNVDLG